MSFRLHHVLAGGLALVLSAATAFAASPSLLDQIRQRGSLRIGLEGTYPPFNYQDETGTLVGFEVDFAKALAAKLGVTADFQPTKWDGMLAALDSKRFDVIINQVTVTPDREKKYDFSTPYTISGIQIITRKGDAARINKPADLAGRQVGVVLGTNYEQWLRAHAPKTEIRTYDDDASRNQDLRVGRIDAILNDRLEAAYLLKKSDGQLVAAGAPFARQVQAIAIRKGNPEFVAAVDKAIASLRADGSLARISAKWFGIDVTK